MDQFTIIVNQLFQFGIMLSAGYCAARTSVLSEPFLSGLARLIMSVLLPILIFANAANGPTRAHLIEGYPIILLSLGMYVGLISITALLAKITGLRRERAGVYRAAMIFGNAGFIGIPLLMGIFPENGAVYIVLMSIVDQGFLWTYGLWLTKPDSDRAAFHLKYFVNPALCAVGLALFFLLLDISLPGVIVRPLLSIGTAATPLSLIYLGGLTYFSNWKPALRCKELYVGIFVKMIVFPIVFHRLASLFCSSRDMVNTLVIVSALPTMVAIAMFAKMQNSEGDYALGLVLATTLASLVTLTIVSYLIF